jgi:hypothetical protein
MARWLIVIVLAACTRTSEKYCGLHPQDLANCPPSDAPRQMCTDDSTCPTESPHCLLESGIGMCVGCRDDGDCALSCDPDSRTCRTCAEHADCIASNACLPEGACGTNDNVIYVSATGTNAGTCPKEAPCKTIAFALGLVTTDRYHIKLSGTLAETVVIAAKHVVLLADPGTKLTGGDPTLKIQQGTVSVYGLEIACGTGAGIKSEMGSTTFLRDVFIHGCGGKGGGIEAKGGFISISRTRIADCPTGALVTDANAVFSVTNTWIYGNGTAAATRSPVAIGATTMGANNRFEHNTVVRNTVKAGATVAGGVACTATNTLAMPHNIIAGNTTTTGVNNNTFGLCDFSDSRVTDDLTEFAFVSEDDLHLTQASSAIDKIEVSGVPDDIDGQFRPLGLRRDYGADEYKP